MSDTTASPIECACRRDESGSRGEAEKRVSGRAEPASPSAECGRMPVHSFSDAYCHPRDSLTTGCDGYRLLWNEAYQGRRALLS